ncbi:MAG: Rap1a/Tai family immunity protein [Mizugakiibacter sp.]|uniref:Rap1a/Tai family immunity protein n=1 Tax=Mizugakiibacter sp. TaxID=1972610 RepID=UPI0031C18549|nr:hypothetical protein [Xanthomonadaceae bacterium]
MERRAVWWFLLALTALACVRSQPASAKEMTIGGLQKICSSQDSNAKMACRLYIVGIYEGITIGMNMADHNYRHLCAPNDKRDAALEKIVMTDLNGNVKASPELRGKPAAEFVGMVMSMMFSCHIQG